MCATGYRGDTGEFPTFRRTPKGTLHYVFDLDGTLAAWDGQSQGRSVGAWREGAGSMVREILDDPDTATVVVASCRATWPDGGGVAAIAEFLWAGGFRVGLVLTDPDDTNQTVWEPILRPDGQPEPPSAMVGIWYGIGKPRGDVYVDDRGLRWLEGIDVLTVKGLAMQR